MASKAQMLAETGELDAVLEARGYAYGLLARAFLEEPQRSLVPTLAQGDAAGLFPFAEGPGLIQQGAAELAAYLADPASATDEAYDRLLWDYTRMFVGPAKPPAPPYESAYLTADRLMFQEQTLAVRQAYRKYGLASVKLGTEPDDHMGLELAFLYETCRLAAQRAAEGDIAGLEQVLGDQRSFLDEHMLKWVSQFAADVAANAQVAFYRGMAKLLDGFVAVDRRLLDQLL